MKHGQKRLHREGRWCAEGVRAYREQEYEIIAELSGTYPVKVLCKYMNIQRSSFYNWRKRLNNPSDKTRSLLSNITLFEEYHANFPSHGYRWLNAKIKLDQCPHLHNRVCKEFVNSVQFSLTSA